MSNSRFWYAFGEHDAYNLWEAPDNVSMAATALAISAGGALSSRHTTPLLTVEETLAALQKPRLSPVGHRARQPRDRLGLRIFGPAIRMKSGRELRCSCYVSLPVNLQPGNHTPPGPQDDAFIDTDGIMQRIGWLVNRVMADRWFAAHVLPQMHVLHWGNKRGD